MKLIMVKGEELKFSVNRNYFFQVRSIDSEYVWVL